jgi:catechol 2,3-dioxygenase-like lactoylglutathione lyase family enzyme
MTPRIQHIAIACDDNVAVAEFYKRAFGMVEVERRPHPTVDGVVFVSVTDGHINLALVPKIVGYEEGINHFGFKVDDVEATCDAAMDQGARPGSDLPRGVNPQVVIIDPTGTRIDLTQKGWAIEP